MRFSPNDLPPGSRRPQPDLKLDTSPRRHVLRLGEAASAVNEAKWTRWGSNAVASAKSRIGGFGLVIGSGVSWAMVMVAFRIETLTAITPSITTSIICLVDQLLSSARAPTRDGLDNIVNAPGTLLLVARQCSKLIQPTLRATPMDKSSKIWLPPGADGATMVLSEEVDSSPQRKRRRYSRTCGASNDR